ncbi:MAG: cytidine deaminase [Clostridia bacterium]
MTWKELYHSAEKYLNERDISPFLHGGQVVAAIETDKGNVYYGVCLDAACGWGLCAERNAILNMITNGESKVVKVVALDKTGCGSPCGACREALMQLDKDSGEMEILIDLETEKTVKLKELVPDWWGKEEFKNK